MRWIKASDLGVDLEPHGKIPDVVIHDVRRNWLFLVEAVTSHGPINIKERKELQVIFADSKAKLVYVAAFSDRNTMKRFITDISWETEVWVADTPDHMIHFDGGFWVPMREHGIWPCSCLPDKTCIPSDESASVHELFIIQYVISAKLSRKI